MANIQNVSIRGVSACVPKQSERIADIKLFDDKSSVRFSKATGIEERRIADNGTFTSDLAKSAIKQLLSDLNWKETDVDVLVVITQTGDYSAPGVALKIHGDLGFKNQCMAFDVNLGCSSFPNGLAIVASILNSMKLSKAILAIADISSRLCHKEDLSTYPLFGDAGSAIALEYDFGENIYFDLNSDGKGLDAIIIKGNGLSSAYSPLDQYNLDDVGRSPWHMRMKGTDVFSFAISVGPETINQVLKNIPDSTSPQAVVLHQANKLINTTIQKKLNLSSTVLFPESLQLFGNTSSVTIPVTFVHNYGGQALNGWYVGAGFGVGLSWGAVAFKAHDLKICKLLEI